MGDDKKWGEYDWTRITLELANDTSISNWQAFEQERKVYWIIL